MEIASNSTLAYYTIKSCSEWRGYASARTLCRGHLSIGNYNGQLLPPRGGRGAPRHPLTTTPGGFTGQRRKEVDQPSSPPSLPSHLSPSLTLASVASLLHSLPSVSLSRVAAPLPVYLYAYPQNSRTHSCLTDSLKGGGKK